MKYSQVEEYLNALYPIKNAEPWDNVGLIFGRRQRPIKSVMTCLTICPAVVEEAVALGVDLLVSHHPFPFKKVNKICDDTFEGKMILDLAKADVNVYSPHTAFDSSTGGINEMILNRLGIEDTKPLIERYEGMGSGRCGKLKQPVNLSQLISTIKTHLKSTHLKVVGDVNQKIGRIAVACGSGGDFFAPARAKGADVFITGEASFHTCVAAKAYGMSMILTGHYESERFAQVALADTLSKKFPDLKVRASQSDKSPVAIH